MSRLDFADHPFAKLDLTAAAARRREYEAYEARRAATRRRLAYERTIPPRYALATLDNWRTPTEAHAQIKAKALDLAAALPAALGAGRCAIFAGTIGTGKDHLAIALGRLAVEAGYSAAWHHATQIYIEMADCYRAERAHADFYGKYAAPDLLIVSDPIDERNWTQAKADCFAKIVHRRYNARRATWVTANLDRADPARQFAEAVGAEIWDRLREKADTFAMYFDSYRTTAWTKRD